jgi:hypothetical protein
MWAQQQHVKVSSVVMALCRMHAAGLYLFPNNNGNSGCSAPNRQQRFHVLQQRPMSASLTGAHHMERCYPALLHRLQCVLNGQGRITLAPRLLTPRRNCTARSKASRDDVHVFPEMQCWCCDAVLLLKRVVVALL